MTKDRTEKRVNDLRFAGIQNDPKFRNIKKGLKVKLDSRFSKKDLEARRKTKVDKYGRKIIGESKDLKDFDKYFEKENESNSEREDDLSTEAENRLVVDRTRCDVSDYTSSESESSESYVSEDESEENKEALGKELNEARPESGDSSKTIAVVNLDWDHVRASDLMVTFSSFLPPGGKIEKICIYPSEFGKERMQREEKEGPPREIFGKKRNHSRDDELKDSDVNIRDLYEEGDADKDVDNAALRLYQLERLRYYYAIVYCNNIETGQAIYSNCDGTEYESTANIFDLRYVPEGMEFNEEPRDECREPPKNYKPLEFSTDALQHSNVKLTWDETPKDRLEVSKRAFTQKELEDMDFQAYLASDSDVSEEDVKTDEETRRKLKSLVGQSLASGDYGDEERRSGMEITFTPGLDGSTPHAEEHHEETTIEKVKRKERERRKARKQKLKELKHQAEKQKKEKLQSMKNKNKLEDESHTNSKTESELVMIENKDETEELLNRKTHFNMKEILKSEREEKKKPKYQNKTKIVEDGFKPDLDDPRFKEVFENEEFAIDPSQPEYKSSKAMEEILEERSKRSRKKRRKPFVGSVADSNNNNKHDVSNIINKLKKKANTRLSDGKSQIKRPKL